MISVTVAINGEPLLRVNARNMGPTCADEAEPGGERIYAWAASNGTAGQVFHHRRDGAAVLAAALLREADLP